VAVPAPENVQGYFSVLHSLCFCHFPHLARLSELIQLNDSIIRLKPELIRSRRNQRNPVENVTKCYL